MMAVFLKCFFGVFILAGIAFSFYALFLLWDTANFVKTSSGRVKGTFSGYEEEWFKTVSSSPSPTNWGQQDFSETWSVMIYPVFSYVAKDGQTLQIREKRPHIFEMFKPGQEVEIMFSPHAEPRLAGFYSLYFRDLVILILGLCFIVIPLLIGRVVIPGLETQAGMQVAAHFQATFAQIAATRVGPMSVATLLKGVAAFLGLVIVISIVAGAVPFLHQLGIGVGSKLITAIEEKRYDDARKLILERKGINRVDDYDRNALLIALERGQPQLARLLIEAGADVNIKSKMYMTPLRVSTQTGDLEMVKLLLARGASPDAPEDEMPPIAYAIVDGDDEIAQALIEGKTDLQRRYMAGERLLTVGDLALLNGRTQLVEMIRQHGGTFTIQDDGITR